MPHNGKTSKRITYVQGSCSCTVPQHKHRLIRCMGAGGGAGEGVLIAWGLCKVRLTQPLYEKCCVLYMYMHLVHIQCTHTGTVLEMMCSVHTYIPLGRETPPPPSPQDSSSTNLVLPGTGALTSSAVSRTQEEHTISKALAQNGYPVTFRFAIPTLRLI